MTLRRISTVAVLMIIGLRLVIGWQLFYEGLWKAKTLNGPRPWSSAGYLKNSQGPLRGAFRAMTGDPNDLDWLDVDQVSSKWNRWQSRFANHYQLDKKQTARLKTLVEGPASFYSDAGALESLPAGIDLTKVGPISYDAEKRRLVVDGRKHLSGSEYAKLLKMLPAAQVGESEIPTEEVVFREQLKKVYARSSRLSMLEKLRASIRGNPNVAGMRNKKGDSQQMGELELYRRMIVDYELAATSARQDFEHEHQRKLWAELQEKRASLVNPMKSLEDEMREKAEDLLTVEQMQRGKLPEPWTSLRIADWLTITGLTICGLCLIAGLFTRFSAIMSAIMLFSFYLAMPPLPGLPDQPGPEHSLIVNKNLIEVVALLAIASFPSGYWFGLDRIVGKWFRRKRKDNEDSIDG